MKTNIYKGIVLPAAMLSAMIIGAGVFSLPYLFNQAGVLIGVYYLFVFSIVLAVVHLMYAEITESTSGEHRFSGYAKTYLGKAGFGASLITTVLGNLLALLIYIVLSIGFIELASGIGGFAAAAVFWAVSTLPILLGVKKIADYSFPVSAVMILIVIGLFIYGVGGLSSDELLSVNINNIYTPYAAVLFSLGGRSAISAIRTYFKSNRLSLKTMDLSILIGTLVPAAVYALFVAGVIGISHDKVSVDAVAGIKDSNALVAAGIAIFGILSIWTSYIFLGIEFKDILHKDLRFKPIVSSFAVVVLPILLYALGLNNLIALIGVSGAVFLALESALVILMWTKVKKRKAPVILALIILIAVFAAGGLHEVASFLS